jgi:hypothetical protein
VRPPAAGRARAGLALALLLPLALAACGKRGPPVAPTLRLPAAVQDLQATIVDDGVELTWSLPRIRVDRSSVKEIRRTEVYRRRENGAPDQPPRPAILTFGGLFGPPAGIPGFERVADILVEEPEGARIEGNQVTYTDTQDLALGRRYTYVVLAVDERGRPSPPSNRVVVALVAPPLPPPGVTAQPGDRQVRLTWEAPPSLADGSPLPAGVIYEVLRATGPDVPGRPVTLEPLTDRQFVDLGVQNETTYYYSVRARLGLGGAQGRPSEVASVTPEDATPPAQPRGLVAVVAGAAVRLAWQAGADPDLAGYHVYRSTTAGRGYTRLTSAPQPASTYVDGDVRPGTTYYYVVTAIDRSRRANESVPSPEAAAAVP